MCGLAAEIATFPGGVAFWVVWCRLPPWSQALLLLAPHLEQAIFILQRLLISWASQIGAGGWVEVHFPSQTAERRMQWAPKTQQALVSGCKPVVD